ncbi:hypothetical protein FHX44_116377 [Pseudonocardia hierapolitana]|uniref:Uncharacterized protein n=1 Tax=Pseudonocardia hierapolitana TaxID=1128676 RepID=A0A561T001_9PSEU|nr:hypothetical protein [Pseudonocardia hierapolitana]TWF80434.1 hypothetical protein FHX44_116377 [Pseudonocardia hierapolitana]
MTAASEAAEDMEAAVAVIGMAARIPGVAAVISAASRVRVAVSGPAIRVIARTFE